MLTDIFPFPLTVNATAIAGTALWSLALYWGFSPVSGWVMEQLTRWFNFAERSLYTSEEEFERTRTARESQNAFWASIFSIVPFLIAGGFCNWAVEAGLGRSWSISVGVIVAVMCGVYELGRRDSQQDG